MKKNGHNVNVTSEIGTLKKVIVHRPDEGIGRISPKKAEELLFDDIVLLPKMQEEHDTFTFILRSFLGDENVLEVGDLIHDALKYGEARKKEEVINRIGSYEELPQRDIELLKSLDNRELTETLITGYCASEDAILFDPIPNFIFTRDIAVTVHDHIIITKAAKEARHRENFLTRFIFWAHPMFAEMHDAGKVINLNDIDKFPPSRKGEQISIEGGDVMMIHDNYLLVGCSERTTSHAIHLLKDVLFEKGLIKNVVQINIPAARSCMHIDTIFTQIHHNHVVGYKPFVVEGKGVNVVVHRDNGDRAHYSSVKDFFLGELNPKMEFILSGEGVSPYQEREQWTDGCNLVALKPGIGLTYDRNPYTEAAFRKFGYDIVHADQLAEDIKAGKVNPAEMENTIINLSSGELSRARGGSHCMTCPIERS